MTQTFLMSAFHKSFFDYSTVKHDFWFFLASEHIQTTGMVFGHLKEYYEKGLLHNDKNVKT